MPLKLCRIHIDIILSLTAKNQLKIPSGTWRTQLVPPQKNDVSSCPAQKSLEISLGGVLPSAPPAPWLGWPPRPSCAPWAREGRGEGPGQGGTAAGQPPSGVAPAAVGGPPAPAGGTAGGGGDGGRDDGAGGDDDDGDDGAGEISGTGAGAGDGGGAGETHGGYFFPPNCPVTPVEGHTSQDGGLEGLLGENIISHDGLGGGGHK
ncbi:hypothetical protein TIFTF001_056587, partial [Ficus carica]